MIKKLVVVFIATIAIQSFSQEGITASPYSFYGIGSLKFKGTVENRSMGGIGVYVDSTHINLRNPASYAGSNVKMYPFNGESRPVKFTVGATHSSLKFNTDSESARNASTSFNYLAMAIPMGKFGMGFGLLPYTAVGYQLESLTGDDGDIQNRFTGEGGLNKAFFGLGYLIAEGLSIGVEAQYNFGNIQNSTVEYVYDSEGIPALYQSRENNRADLSGFNFNFGLTYKTMVAEKLELMSSITFTPESNLVSQNQRRFSTVSTTANGVEIEVDGIDVDLEALGLLETDLTLPSKYSVGVGIGNPRKWFVGGEYTAKKTSDFVNELYSVNLQNSTRYENASTISFGGFYIPQYNSFNNYLKRIVYRAGVRYEKTGLNISNQSINEFGMSFGVGLPVGNFLSNVNLGLEIGKRGTTKNNLIEEDFINFHLSLSLNDRWFQKRKYD